MAIRTFNYTGTMATYYRTKARRLEARLELLAAAYALLLALWVAVVF